MPLEGAPSQTSRAVALGRGRSSRAAAAGAARGVSGRRRASAIFRGGGGGSHGGWRGRRVSGEASFRGAAGGRLRRAVPLLLGEREAMESAHGVHPAPPA